MNLTVDHYAVRTMDMDKSIEFYCQKLGLKLISKTVDKEHNEVFAFLKFDNAVLELIQGLENTDLTAKPKINPPYAPHLAIKTDDLESLLLLLVQKNIDIVKGPLEIKNRVKWLYIADPDNNIIEFVQWLDS